LRDELILVWHARFSPVVEHGCHVRRIRRDDLARHQPVEQHADRREVLLDGWLLEILTQPADVGGDMHRFDVGDLIDVGARFAPGEEAPRRGCSGSRS
jgi:hypothetical protein